MMAENPVSKLPEDPAYWRRLSRQISDDAAAPLAAYAGEHDVWYGSLARNAPWVVAASAAAMLVLWFALPTTDSPQVARWFESSLAPNEIAGTLVGGPVPPSVDELMAQFPPALDGEGTR